MTNNQVKAAENESIKQYVLWMIVIKFYIEKPIYIWDNNKTGNQWEIMTICNYCHGELDNFCHSKEWEHDKEVDVGED